ncbi:beta-xylosidase [Pontibacter diazotrophicus]|uniref:Beta-xylosidase n=1 Tax=Pontibacter diazotrophicus TaxID=1400979 RepID=A0A3D8LI60_9BACT|nr:glycoside hydrolase family 43 protein [Pontibacter diazotrophicus]RDV16572.1 beta-xylosidase [Pontibacter diazotrophicus]
MTSKNRALKFIAVSISYFLIAFWICSCSLRSQAQDAAEESSINLADPTVFYHEGTYYLYGTVEGNADEGFEVYTSKDMKSWEGPAGVRDGFALKQGEAFGTKGFWAPQVFYHQGKFYMAYTANENIAIAESNSPLGPFKQQVKQPLAVPVKQIDPFIFMDDDGKKYLYHVRLKDGNRIFVAEMTDNFSGIKEETLRECIAAEEPWENTANADWPVAEGPTVLKHKGLYYMIYSANDFRNPDYAVGYATSRSPLGPWVKHNSSPVISTKTIGESGTGHGDILKDKSGNLVYVFHTHQSDTTVAPRKTAMVKANFLESPGGGEAKLIVDPNSFFYPKVKH